MQDGSFEITLGVTIHRGAPFIESRARATRENALIPEGKVLVVRMPILPPGASEEDVKTLTETEIMDDEGP